MAEYGVSSRVTSLSLIGIRNKVCTTLGPLSPDALGNFVRPSTVSRVRQLIPSQGNCQSYDIGTYGNFANGSCITSPNLHTRNKSDAA
jgi:hypothetical protein